MAAVGDAELGLRGPDDESGLSPDAGEELDPPPVPLSPFPGAAAVEAFGVTPLGDEEPGPTWEPCHGVAFAPVHAGADDPSPLGSSARPRRELPDGVCCPPCSAVCTTFEVVGTEPPMITAPTTARAAVGMVANRARRRRRNCLPRR